MNRGANKLFLLINLIVSASMVSRVCQLKPNGIERIC